MNILSMRWTDLDLINGMWIIPASASKNKKSMGVSLIDEAIAILEERKEKATSIFVFPSTGKKGHIVEVRRSFGSILKRAEIADFHFHDLRRTLGSWQAHIGASDIIIAKSLGHASTQSTKVYARIRDANPIRESMAKAVRAMREASKNKKIVNIKGGE